MSLESLWEVFIRFVWPLVLVYAGYVHKELADLMKRFEALQKLHHEHVAQVNKDFATKTDLSTMETRVTTVLNRIDDKVTRILEREAK